MLSNLLKLSLRALLRDRLYSAINIAGLVAAFASCLVLGLYLYTELSYDRHHVGHERIFRVANAYQDYDTGNQRREVALTSPVLGPMLVQDYPEIEAYVRLEPTDGDVLLRRGDEAFYWDKAYYADANVFEVFTHRILHGDPATALDDPLSVAISATVMRRYFGDRDPVGETLELGDGTARRVSLVFADLPGTSHLRYDLLFANTAETGALADTDSARRLFGVNTYTYLLMPENFRAEQFAPMAADFFRRHMEQLSRERTNRAWSGWLQPLASLHLGPTLLNDLPTGNRFQLYGFAAAACFILLAAAINYMNLSTATYTRRYKEVGIRKILGEGRGTLLLQFLLEAFLLVMISAGLGVVLIELAAGSSLPGQLLGSALTFDVLRQPSSLALLVGLALVLAGCAGLYPALHLSSFKPLAAVKSGSARAGGSRLREVLLFVQFTLAVAVVASTALMLLQMRFVAQQPLGFQKENRVLVTLRDPALVAQLPVLQERLRQQPGIRDVSYASAMMGQEISVNSSGLEANDGTRTPVQLGHMAVDANFIDVMGMHLARGRNFSSEISTDASGALLVNQALVDYMQWDEPIGKTIRSTWGTEGVVIGVVENFNFRSLHTTVEPFFLYQPAFSNRLGPERELVVSIDAEDVVTTLGHIEETLKELSPQSPFAYQFLDDSLDTLYLSDTRLMMLLGMFAGLCLFITCLGLLGLTIYTTAQRSKEMGMRKVLGATNMQVMLLLLNRIVVLALAGAVVATVLAFPVMDAWLARFAYRISISPLVFIASAALVLAFAIGTVVLKAVQLSALRPVETLRYE